MTSVTGTFTWPVTRKSGAALALTDIKNGVLTRNGVSIQTLVANGPTATFTDTTPLTGADDYNVETVTNDGFISDPSNNAIVTIAAADPATAVTDLTAKIVP
jgi:hypothetical protein